MAELGLLHCWSTFPAVPRENARKTDKALVKLISKITKINYPDGILSSFEEIGRLPGPPPFRLDPRAVCLLLLLHMENTEEMTAFVKDNCC